MTGLHWLLIFAMLELVCSRAVLQETQVPGVVDCLQGGSYLTLTKMFWVTSTTASQVLHVELLNEKAEFEGTSYQICWVSSTNENTCHWRSLISNIAWSQQQSQTFEFSVFKQLSVDTYIYTFYLDQNCFLGSVNVTLPTANDVSNWDCRQRGSVLVVKTMYWTNPIPGKFATLNIVGFNNLCYSFSMYFTEVDLKNSENPDLSTGLLVVNGVNQVGCLSEFSTQIDVLLAQSTLSAEKYTFRVQFYDTSKSMNTCWISSLSLMDSTAVMSARPEVEFI